MGWGVPACPQNSTVSDNLSDNVWYSAKTTAFYENQEKQQNLRQFPSPPVPPPPPVILPVQNQSCRYQKDKFDFYSALGANIASETVAGRQFATQSSSSSAYSTIHEAAAAAATSGNPSSIYGTGGYHLQVSPAAAAVAALHETANARNCALPSPTIYPPTPPPSAPWVHPHPWFGDTF